MEFWRLLAVAGAEAAAEVEEAAEGFGFNFDILETNLVNLAIVIALLVYLGRTVFGSMLQARRTTIADAIADAEQRNQKAKAALAEQQNNLAQAQQEAERIKAAAEDSAKAAREAILAQAKRDVERMKESAAQDLSAEQARVIASLRQRVVSLALQKAEAQLADRLDDATRQRLIDRNIAMLGS